MACECTTVVRGQHSSRSPMKAGGPTHASIFSRLGLFHKHKHLVLMPDQAASFKHLGGTIRHGPSVPMQSSSRRCCGIWQPLCPMPASSKPVSQCPVP